MDLSQRGIELIKSFEGCHRKRKDGKIEAYLCPARVPTIGWGCTKGVKLGMVVTPEEAERMFIKELAVFEDAVERLVKVPMHQWMFDVLVSFSYNVGSGALSKSTLLRLLNKGQYEAVPAQLMRYRYAAGKELSGLVRRRAAEAALWREGMAEIAKGAAAVDAIMPDRATPDEVIDEDEVMPQAVETAPTPSVPAAAVKSGTVWTSTVGFFTAIAAGVQEFFGAANTTAAETLALKQSYGPLESFGGMLLKNGPMIASVVLGGCFVVVIVRHIAAVREGRHVSG